MQRYSGNIISLVGPPFIGLTPTPGVGLESLGFTVTVRTYPALTIPTIYSGNGTGATANPIIVPPSGDFSFYAANDHYEIEISKPGVLSKKISDIVLEGLLIVNCGTPGSVPANSTLEHLIEVPGVLIGDYVSVTKPTHQVGLGIVGARVQSAGFLAVTYMNTTVSGIFPTGGEIYLVSHRRA